MVLDFNKPETATAVGGELEATAHALAERLTTTAITDLASLEQAVLDRQAIGEAAKRVETFFEPFISSAHKLHKMLCDRKNAILGPLLRLDVAKRTAITDYKWQEDRRRQLREQEIAAQRRRDSEASAASEAAHLESAGEHALAAAVVNEAIAAPAPVVVLPDVTKTVPDLKFRREWKWRVRNAALVPRDYLCIDEKKVGGYTRSMKGSGAIPGIDIYFEDVPIR